MINIGKIPTVKDQTKEIEAENILTDIIRQFSNGKKIHTCTSEFNSTVSLYVYGKPKTTFCWWRERPKIRKSKYTPISP